MLFFEFFYLIALVEQVVYVVIAIDQTGFFVGVYVEVFAQGTIFYPYFLRRQVNDKTCTRVLLYALKDLIQGSRPLLSALPRKISAKKLDTTALNPKSYMAQAACSRLDPQPKLRPATRISP